MTAEEPLPSMTLTITAHNHVMPGVDPGLIITGFEDGSLKLADALLKTGEAMQDITFYLTPPQAEILAAFVSMLRGRNELVRPAVREGLVSPPRPAARIVA